LEVEIATKKAAINGELLEQKKIKKIENSGGGQQSSGAARVPYHLERE
jgi:hypothetical protein